LKPLSVCTAHSGTESVFYPTIGRNVTADIWSRPIPNPFNKFTVDRTDDDGKLMSALLRSAVRTTTTTRSLLRSSARSFSGSCFCRQEQTTTTTTKQKTGFDYHTVEDLHGMSAAEILSGPEEDRKMRHFTGAFVVFCSKKVFP
jgi:hypothetical protein